MRWFGALFLLLVLACAAQPANAQSCTGAVTDVDFGSAQLLTGGDVDVTGTVTVTCTNIWFDQNQVCVSFEYGSGGTSGSSRLLAGPGGSTLTYNLYSDAARTQRWGSRTDTTLGDHVIIPITGNGSSSVSFTRTIYGRLNGPQPTASTGSYSSSFTGEANFRFSEPDRPNCGGDRPYPNRSASFTVKAQLSPYCDISVQDLDFGNRGVIDSALDASTSMSVTCTKSTSYSVALSGGASGDTAARTLVRSGRTIGYQLYRDAGRSQAWAAAGASGTGTGSAQNHTIYGRVPAQATPPPGLYSDTVVATVTY